MLNENGRTDRKWRRQLILKWWRFVSILVNVSRINVVCGDKDCGPLFSLPIQMFPLTFFLSINDKLWTISWIVFFRFDSVWRNARPVWKDITA
jgi:hypothetical protein